MTQEIAIQRIAATREANAIALDLRNLSLTTVPDELWELINLQRLDLSGNRLTGIAPDIGQLTKLSLLILDNNQLTAVPAEIGKLTQLTALFLENNQLTAVPPEIKQLPLLNALFLGGNPLVDNLPKLIELSTEDRSVLLARLMGWYIETAPTESTGEINVLMYNAAGRFITRNFDYTESGDEAWYYNCLNFGGRGRDHNFYSKDNLSQVRLAMNWAREGKISDDKGWFEWLAMQFAYDLDELDGKPTGQEIVLNAIITKAAQKQKVQPFRLSPCDYAYDQVVFH